MAYLTDAERDLAVKLLRQGHATVGELAQLLGVTRQSLQQLADRRGLKGEVVKIREAYLKQMWKRASKGGD